MQRNQEHVQVAFKNCASVTNCISDIRNTRVDETKNRRNLRIDSIRVSDILFGIELETLSTFFLHFLKFFLRPLMFV